MNENSNQKEKDTFSEIKKHTYDYFKQIATYSISLIALYGGLIKFARPDDEVSLNFLIGVTLLFIAVI